MFYRDKETTVFHSTTLTKNAATRHSNTGHVLSIRLSYERGFESSVISYFYLLAQHGKQPPCFVVKLIMKPGSDQAMWM